MLRLLVPPEVDFSLEGSAAEVTCEGLKARVLPGMRYEIGRLTECLTADRAFVRFFA